MERCQGQLSFSPNYLSRLLESYFGNMHREEGDAIGSQDELFFAYQFVWLEINRFPA
jgi:hypothetical protein